MTFLYTMLNRKEYTSQQVGYATSADISQTFLKAIEILSYKITAWDSNFCVIYCTFRVHITSRSSRRGHYEGD